MDYSGTSMYLNQRSTVVEAPHYGTVPSSIPMNNGQMGDYTSGVPEAHMLSNHTNYTYNTNSHNVAEHHNNQVPLRNDDEEETKYSIPTYAVPHPVHNEVKHDVFDEGMEIKTEAQEDEAFVTANHDTLLQISLKELTIKQAADKLERPYSYVYRRYQEFSSKVTGVQPPKKKGGNMARKDGKKKRRPKKLTIIKSRPKLTGEIYQCEECPASFYRESQLKTHSKVHNVENESHPCTACGVVFPKLKKLMLHRVSFHEEALQCPHCEAQFTKVSAYTYHMKTHNRGEKPFKCKECGKGFYQKASLIVHKRIHTGEKPFMCGYCDKAFITLSKLKQHHHIHTGTQDKTKPFECEDCGKRYAANSSLLEHMNIHKGIKPYSCDECEARFNFKQNLRRHKMAHSGETPFKCDFCDAAFQLSTDLQRHTTVHTGLKPFKCDMCEYTCTRKTSLEYHQNTHTGVTPYKCDFPGCDMEYSRPNSLKKHKLKHGPPPPVSCKICNEQFPDPYELKGHMMLHTGEKPFVCDQCPKVCYDESALKRHKYKHMYKPFENKPKQIRPKKRYIEPKKPALTESITSKWPTDGYQVPQVATSAQKAHIQQPAPVVNHYAWNINAEDSNSQPAAQPSYQHYTPSHYSNIINNAWPTAVDPDELRRRLLNSFK